MKHLLVIICSAIAIGLYGCSQDPEVSTQETSTTEQAEPEMTEQQETHSSQGSEKEQFSIDIGKLYGFDIRSVVADLVQDSFNSGFADGSNQAAPKYPGQELGELLQKLEADRRSQTENEDATPYQAGADKEKISYALGYVQGSQIQQIADDLVSEVFLESFANAYTNGIEDAEEVEARVRAHFEELQTKQAAEREQVGQANLDKSNEFLQKNKDEEGVITKASGLQYKVITMGDGDKPTEADQVEVHYEGTLLDGTVFDSSYERNQTATFPLTGVISGWTEGLQYMPVGSKFRFFLHPDLAYGAQGSGNRIGPNELLMFDVELISIK